VPRQWIVGFRRISATTTAITGGTGRGRGTLRPAADGAHGTRTAGGEIERRQGHEGLGDVRARAGWLVDGNR